MEHQETEAVQVHREDWRRRAESFLKQAELKTGEGCNTRKTLRLKTFEWLLCLNNVLKVLADISLDHFQVPEALPDRPDPGQWPFLVINADRGSDGFAAQYFLRYAGRCAIFFVGDASHKAWNACSNALKKTGHWSTVLLASAMMNVDHAPYHNAKFFQAGKEMIHLYVKMTSPQECPIYLFLRDRIVKELGLENSISDPKLDSFIWDQLAEAWQHKCERVGPSRWFHFAHAVRKFNSIWTSRLLGTIFHALQEGLFAGTSPMMLGKSMAHFEQLKAGDKTQAANEDPELQKLRKATKNSLEFSCCVLWDPWIQEQSILVSALLEPFASACPARLHRLVDIRQLLGAHAT